MCAGTPTWVGKHKEVEVLVKEGINHVTPEMWRKAVEKVEQMEEEMFIDDVMDDIDLEEGEE
jgi:predicted Zn-dependent protease with MMP-like domain